MDVLVVECFRVCYCYSSAVPMARAPKQLHIRAVFRTSTQLKNKAFPKEWKCRTCLNIVVHLLCISYRREELLAEPSPCVHRVQPRVVFLRISSELTLGSSSESCSCDFQHSVLGQSVVRKACTTPGNKLKQIRIKYVKK